LAKLQPKVSILFAFGATLIASQALAKLPSQSATEPDVPKTSSRTECGMPTTMIKVYDWLPQFNAQVKQKLSNMTSNISNSANCSLDVAFSESGKVISVEIVRSTGSAEIDHEIVKNLSNLSFSDFPKEPILLDAGLILRIDMGSLTPSSSLGIPKKIKIGQYGK